MLALITQGIGFGFGAGTMPGPLQSFIISTTVSYGWRRGIVIIFSPLIADAPIIILMAFLLKSLPDSITRLIQIAGGLFVLWLAWGTFRALRSGTLILGATDDQVVIPRRQTLAQATTINLLSPGPYIFWGSVTGPILVAGLEQSALHGILFLLAFYGTFLAVMAAFVFTFDRLRRLDERLSRAIVLLAVVVMAGLGIQLIVSGFLS